MSLFSCANDCGMRLQINNGTNNAFLYLNSSILHIPSLNNIPSILQAQQLTKIFGFTVLQMVCHTFKRNIKRVEYYISDEGKFYAMHTDIHIIDIIQQWALASQQRFDSTNVFYVSTYIHIQYIIYLQYYVQCITVYKHVLSYTIFKRG